MPFDTQKRETAIAIILFYLPAAVSGLAFLFLCFLGSEYMSCIEKLKDQLPPQRDRSCLHMSYMQFKAMKLAEQELPQLAQRMKHLIRLGLKAVVVLLVLLVITATGGIVTGRIN